MTQDEQILYPQSRTPALTESEIANLDAYADAVGLPRWEHASIAGKLEILCNVGRHPRGRWEYMGLVWRNRRYADAYAQLDKGEAATDRAIPKAEAIASIARLRATLIEQGYTLDRDELLSVAGHISARRSALTYSPIDGGYVGIDAA